MAKQAGKDRMTMDIRSELKRVATKGGRYFTGTARMFLDSTTDVVTNTMPTVGAMLDTNKALIDDTLRFLRHPVDALNRGMDRINQDENVQAVRKFARDALDDLRTGNIYDPERDRSGFGTSIDSLLDNFGDIDMSGFDVDGEYTEPEIEGMRHDEDMLESHEVAEDTRTGATIEAVEKTGKAIVANANYNYQTDIRLGIKQHAQIMGSMSNVITQQGALLDTVNAMASSLLEVQRETHQDLMNSLNTINETLGQIQTQTGPPPKEEVTRPENDSVFGSNGEIDIRKWLAAARKNMDDKYGISTTLSMMTMGMSPKQLIELVADNPWKLVSDQIVGKIIPDYLKDTMETTQKYMENFFPSLLAKLADQGDRFDRDTSEGGGRFRDLIAGIFGVKPQRGGSLDLSPRDIGKRAEITNRTVQAIEQVIPMWLSKIYTAISGDELSMWNYSKGTIDSVARTVSDTLHDSNDLVGRMGSGARNFYNRATSKDAFQFVDPEMQKEWENYLYRFMQRAGENGSFLNYNMSKEDFMRMMPDDTNKDLWYRMITATLSHMPKNEIMALNSEINKARYSQRLADERIAEDLRESRMDISHAMLNKDFMSDIENSTIMYRRGLDDDQIQKLRAENQKQMAAKGKGLMATNEHLNEITSMLKRGIITYTHIIGGTDGNPLDPGSEVGRRFANVSADAETENDRLTRIANRKREEREDRDRRRQDEVQRNELSSVTDRANNKVWIGRNTRDIDQISFDLAQGSLVINSTQDGMSDNRMTEEQRQREDRKNKIRGLAEGRINRVKDAFHMDDADTFGKKVQKILESPFGIVDLALRTADQFMFKLIYGEDAPILDDPEHPERDEKARSLMDVMERKMRAQWASTKEWFKEYIGNPIKDFFMGEQGLLGKIKNRLEDAVIEPVAKKAKDIKNKVKSKVLGTQEIVTKYIDDPDNPGQKKMVTEKGEYSGGILSGAINKLQGTKRNVKEKGLGMLDTFLYDTDYGKRYKGKTYIADDIELDDEGNQVITEGHYEYTGAVGAAREIVDKAAATINQWLFGEDENGDDHGSKEKFNMVKEEVSKAFPDMTIGAGVGLVGSLFLPGGPILGAVLGSMGGLVAGSDRLKNYLFGEEEMDHTYTEYNWKTGQIEEVKGKGRKGGIVPAEMQDAFKKYFPKMGIGAGIGLIGSMFLPGGPVIGSILGATGGMVAASDRLKQVIFGDGTVDENGKENGILPPSTRKKIVEAVKQNAPGIIGGAVGGAKLGSMLGAGLGLIPGLSLLPTGPIFTMLGGITGAIGGKTIQQYFFGEEQEVTTTDPETGEVKTEKKRVGGLFGKAYDFVQKKLFIPFGEKLTAVSDKVKDWFNSDVVGPLAHLANPLRDAMEKTKTDIEDAFHHMGDHIRASLDSVFQNSFGTSMGEFFEEKVKKPLSNMMNKILGGIGKAIGAVISAPFKLLDYMITGNTKKVDEYGNVIDEDLDSDEEATGGWFRRRRKSKEKKSLMQRYLDWRDKGTEEVNENMRNTNRYYDATVEDFYPPEMKISDREQAKLNEEAYKQSMAAERAERKARRQEFTATIKDKLSGLFKRPGEDGEESPSSKPEVFGPMPETRQQRNDRLKREREEERARKKQERLDARAKRKEEREAKKKPKEKNPTDTVSGETVDQAQTENVQKGKQKSKNAVYYLKNIDRTITKIYKEIRGNLNGLGWNVAYIKTQFDKKLGKLKPEELPEEMEGSKRTIKRRRGIIGKAIDGVKDFGGKVKDRALDVRDAAVDKVKDITQVVTAPFKVLGKAARGTAKAIGSFGGTLLDILGKLAKGFAEGMGKILKGAGELIGKTIGGVGKMIWNAGAGIGKALGNTVSLVSEVIKNFGSAVAAGIGGVAKVVAHVVPDIANGIWNAVTKTAGTLWKGTKWVGGKIWDGGKWAVGKLFGKDKKDKKAKSVAEQKIADTIDNGYMAMGIGRKKDLHPYPFVTYAKNKLISKLNDTAIPVWIMGSSASINTTNSFGPDVEGEPVSENRWYSRLLDGIDVYDDETKDFIHQQMKESEDLVKGYGTVFGKDFATDPNFMRNMANEMDRNPLLGDVDTNLATLMTYHMSGDMVNPIVTKLDEIHVTVKDIYSVVSNGVPGRKVDPDTGAAEVVQIPAAPTARVPVSSQDVTSSPIALPPSTVEAAGEGDFKDWKKAYQRTDRKAESARNPAQVYDDAISRAKSKQEAEGILAAEEMNDKLAIAGVGGGGTGAAEEGGKSLFETLFGSGDGGGIGRSIMSALGGTAAGASVLSMFNKLKKGAASGFQRFGSTLVKNAPFLIGTGMAMENGDDARVGMNFLRHAERRTIPYLTKGLADVGKIDLDPKAKKKLVTIIAESFSANLTKLANNQTILRALGRINPKWPKAFVNCLDSINLKFLEGVEKLGSKALRETLEKASVVIEVASIIADYISGKERAPEYFKVSEYAVTDAMRETCGIVNAISGFCYGLIPVSWLTDLIYKAFASEPEMNRINEERKKNEQRTLEHNKATGDNLTPTEFAKKYHEDGTKKTWYDSLGGFMAQTIKSIPGISSAEKGYVEMAKRFGWLGENDYDYSTYSPITDALTGDHRDKTAQRDLATATGTLMGFLPSTIGGANYNPDKNAQAPMAAFNKKRELIEYVQSLTELYPDVKTKLTDLITDFEAISDPSVADATKFIGAVIETLPKENPNSERGGGFGKDSVGSGGFGTSTPTTTEGTETPAITTPIVTNIPSGIYSPYLNNPTRTGQPVVQNPMGNGGSFKVPTTGKGPGWGTGRVNPMDQTSSIWSEKSKDLDKVGCGPTAAAMIGSAYGDKSTPVDADIMSKDLGMRASDGGTNPKFFSKFANGKGYGMSEGPTDSNRIAGSLNNGNPIALMGEGGAFGNNMHYMVADSMSGKGNVNLIDPIGGVRKTASLESLTKNTKDTIYSYGKGPVEMEPQPSGGQTAAKDEQAEEAQQALVSQMQWLHDNPIPYSLGSVQDPDKGEASCASTVGWAYRKALGVDGMSASSTTQSTDDRFTTIWTNQGEPLDTSLLKPGDILYQNWDQTRNNGAMKHTEMYAGQDQDLSHGGPGRGPVYKDLNDYRKNHTMMVRRYTPLITGEDIQEINSRGGGFGLDRSTGNTSGSGTISAGSFGAFDSPGITLDSDGSAKFQLDSSGNFTFLNNLDTFFGNVAGKLSNVMDNMMGIKTEETTDDTSSDGSSTGNSSGSKDSSFVPTTGGSVDGTDVTANTYNYLRSMGFSKIASSGIMGNLDAESGIRPDNVQNGTYDSSLSYADEDRKYVADVESGAHDFVNDSKGWGLAQWTYFSRKQGLLDKVKEQDARITDLNPQLEHLWDELNSYQVAGPLNKAKSIKEASNIMLHDFEAPKDQGPDVENYRADLSQKWYDTYAENETPDPETTEAAPGSENAANIDAETEGMETGKGRGWGAGPDGLSLGLEALNYKVADINKYLEQHNEEQASQDSVSAITQKITDSISQATGGTPTDAMFQAMASSMAQMVELLSKIAENTKKDTNEHDPVTRGKGKTSMPRITRYPSGDPKAENGMTHPTAIGAEIIDQMTANRR